MTRTVISQTDLEDKASEIVERVRRGEMAVVESSGEEQIVLLDAADFRLLQALAACATELAEPTAGISHDVRVLDARQLAESLGLVSQVLSAASVTWSNAPFLDLSAADLPLARGALLLRLTPVPTQK